MATVAEVNCRRIRPALAEYFGQGAVIVESPVYRVIRGPGELDMALALVRGTCVEFTVECGEGKELRRYTYSSCRVPVWCSTREYTFGRWAKICVSTVNKPLSEWVKKAGWTEEDLRGQPVRFIGEYNTTTRSGIFQQVEIP